MRTRTRTVVENTASSVYKRWYVRPVSQQVNNITTTTAPRSFDALIESMIDEEPKLSRSGNVLHTKTLVSEPPVTIEFEFPYAGSYTPTTNPVYLYSWSGNAALWHFVGVTNYRNTNFFPSPTVPSTFDWGQLSFFAYKQMKPDLNKEGLLLNNAVAEATQAARAAYARSNRNRMDDKIVPDYGRLSKREQHRGEIRNGKVIIKGPRVPFDSPKPASSKTPAKALPKGWPARAMGALRKVGQFNLLYQFVIRPTISDVLLTLDRVKTLEKRLEELIRLGDEKQTRHYTCPLVDRMTLPADYVYQDAVLFNDWCGHKTYVQSKWKDRPVYHAAMRYKHDTSALKSTLGRLRAYMNAFGVSDVIATLWEAVPYSFVVDWFFNVGSMLASIEDYLVGDPLPIVILDFTHSVKYKFTTRVLLDIGKGNWSKATGILLQEKETTYYNRRVEMPNFYDSLSVRAPSVNQPLLGGSLLIAGS
jgi:hypothetical protein